MRAAMRLRKALNLGEGHLDGIEVGAVGRQEAQFCAGLLDRLSGGGWLLGGQIVHDDDVAGLEGRDQDLLDIT